MGVQTWCNFFLSKSTAEALTISQYMSNHYKQGGRAKRAPLLHPFCIFHHVATPIACSVM